MAAQAAGGLPGRAGPGGTGRGLEAGGGAPPPAARQPPSDRPPAATGLCPAGECGRSWCRSRCRSLRFCPTRAGSASAGRGERAAGPGAPPRCHCTPGGDRPVLLRRRGGAGDGPAGRLRTPPACPGPPVLRAGRGPCVTGTGSAAGTRGGLAPGPKPATLGPEAPPCPTAVPPAWLSPGALGGLGGRVRCGPGGRLPPKAFVTPRLPVLG